MMNKRVVCLVMTVLLIFAMVGCNRNIGADPTGESLQSVPTEATVGVPEKEVTVAQDQKDETAHREDVVTTPTPEADADVKSCKVDDVGDYYVPAVTPSRENDVGVTVGRVEAAEAGVAIEPAPTEAVGSGGDTNVAVPPQQTEPPHVHNYSETVVDPGCEVGGYTAYACVCGDSYADGYTNARGHSWGEWVTTQEATTSSEGQEVRTCGNCGATETQTIAKLVEYVNFVVTADNRDMVGYVGEAGEELNINVVFQSDRAYDVDGDGVEEPAGTWYKVVGIGEGAFRECSALTSVTIPEGVTSIGKNAFFRCSGLKNVSLPESVVFIGKSCFSECESLESIIIPSGVTVIEDNTFTWCISLTNVVIPDGVTYIGYAAFAKCSFSNITLPANLETIGGRAFWCCDNLEDITIPTGVTSIGLRTFYECYLGDIYYLGSEEQWNAIDIDADNEDLFSYRIHYSGS